MVSSAWKVYDLHGNIKAPAVAADHHRGRAISIATTTIRRPSAEADIDFVYRHLRNTVRPVLGLLRQERGVYQAEVIGAAAKSRVDPEIAALLGVSTTVRKPFTRKPPSQTGIFSSIAGFQARGLSRSITPRASPPGNGRLSDFTRTNSRPAHSATSPPKKWSASASAGVFAP